MSFQETVGWKAMAELSPSKPSPRSGHSLISDNDKRCYLFGGYGGLVCNNELYVFTIADECSTGEWTEVQTSSAKPSPRASHAACNCGNKGMFIVGGSGERFGFSNLGDAYFFDYVERRWYDLSLGGLLEARGQATSLEDQLPLGLRKENFTRSLPPPPAYGRCCVYDESTDLIWVFGGTDGVVYFNSLWCFHLSSGAWYMLAKSSGERPQPMYSAKAALSSGNLLFVGGGLAPFCYAANPIEIFHFDTKCLVWSKLKIPFDLHVSQNWPSARLAHAFTQLDENRLFIFGGSTRDADPRHAGRDMALGDNIRAYKDSKTLDDGWIYRIDVNRWDKIESERGPGRRDFVAVATLRGGADILLFGGYNSKERTNDAFRLRLRHVVPSLERMCVKRLHDLHQEDPNALPSSFELEGYLPDSILDEIFGIAGT